MTAKSQTEANARSEPRMTKNFGRVLERNTMASAERVTRAMINAWTAVETSPVVVISGEDMNDERDQKYSKSPYHLCSP